jgi:hypothetical protein
MSAVHQEQLNLDHSKNQKRPPRHPAFQGQGSVCVSVLPTVDLHQMSEIRKKKKRGQRLPDMLTNQILPTATSPLLSMSGSTETVLLAPGLMIIR